MCSVWHVLKSMIDDLIERYYTKSTVEAPHLAIAPEVAYRSGTNNHETPPFYTAPHPFQPCESNQSICCTCGCRMVGHLMVNDGNIESARQAEERIRTSTMPVAPTPQRRSHPAEQRAYAAKNPRQAEMRRRLDAMNEDDRRDAVMKMSTTQKAILNWGDAYGPPGLATIPESSGPVDSGSSSSDFGGGDSGGGGSSDSY